MFARRVVCLRSVVLLALLLLLAGTASCAGGLPLNGYPDSPEMRGSAGWATQFLGTPPDATAAVRIASIRDAETSYGEYGEIYQELRKVMRYGSPAGDAFEHCRQADLYLSRASLGGGITLIAVLHGVPPSFDPLQPYPYGESPCRGCMTLTGPRFTLQGQARSGARAYLAVDDRTTQLVGDRTTQIFVLPSSTWVVANGVAGARLASALASDSREPPLIHQLTWRC